MAASLIRLRSLRCLLRAKRRLASIVIPPLVHPAVHSLGVPTRGVSLTEEGVAFLVGFGVADEGIGPMVQKRKNEITVVVALSIQLVAPSAVVGVEPAHPAFGLLDEPFLISLADGFLGTGLGVDDCQRGYEFGTDRTHLEV